MKAQEWKLDYLAKNQFVWSYIYMIDFKSQQTILFCEILL